MNDTVFLFRYKLRILLHHNGCYLISVLRTMCLKIVQDFHRKYHVVVYPFLQVIISQHFFVYEEIDPLFLREVC